MAESVTCDKGANGIWNNNEWTIAISNLTQSKTTCNIAFINEMGMLVYEIKQQFGGAEAITEAPAGTFASVSSASDALFCND